MAKIRVLVANRPRLMRELVMATIADQPDIEIAGEITEDSQIAQVVADCRPDFVIVALDRAGERPAICDVLLARYPEVKILALAADSNNGVFFWSVSDIRSARIESSEEAILCALRGKSQAAVQ